RLVVHLVAAHQALQLRAPLLQFPDAGLQGAEAAGQQRLVIDQYAIPLRWRGRRLCRPTPHSLTGARTSPYLTPTAPLGRAPARLLVAPCGRLDELGNADTRLATAFVEFPYLRIGAFLAATGPDHGFLVHAL